ncbi:MAG: formate-dependent phosphoribosylglycinamide formyltransferase, partial [Bacteroidales bacterium]|nr:formate-dependent phosphoribosylglycinamide formyltransferase [Bacteroidales bacterium]
MSTKIGTPFTENATRVMLLGSGELGKEVAIEFQRFGVEVIACDSYENAPAMQVADRSYVFSMLDGDNLRRVIELEKPTHIVPEVEAIATDVLIDLEKDGFNVTPTASATWLTMNREGIRNLTAGDLVNKTSPFVFAGTKEEFVAGIEKIGMPCVIKPIMSSSGKGQSTVKSADDIDKAWTYAVEGGRGASDRVIVEGFVDFDYEITLLTIKHKDGVSFCAPIGHRQEGGDYQES